MARWKDRCKHRSDGEKADVQEPKTDPDIELAFEVDPATLLRKEDKPVKKEKG